MKQITKITLALTLLISLASCQSSKVGCYDFGAVQPEIKKDHLQDQNLDVQFKNVACKP